ncbi:hypothetical protein A9Q84_13895 [Halobacteriovorax marinus]|uniref:Uncharacterized protein n=1 Tax=Halobacteriovorax marinus TaxID=97084 RepID=A0A1Y5F954_9BACT|nr:hypothetical protein A9Q84_13895 [Halobacteriovorax marinus]
MFLFLLLYCCNLSAKKTGPSDNITWRVVDWPPFYITNPTSNEKGLYDGFIEQVSLELPEYKHHKVKMNTLRARKQMKMGEKICHPSVLPDTDALLSKVNSILLPHKLIVRNEVSKLIEKRNKTMSLIDVLNMKGITIGISPDSYTTKLNKITKRYLKKSNVFINNDYVNLIKMLFLGRVDVIIQYSPIVRYLSHKENREDIYKVYNIKEIKDQKYTLVHVACPKNAWGKRVINKINNFLVKESRNSRYIDHRIRWYSKEERSILKEYYKKIYLKDKR